MVVSYGGQGASVGVRWGPWKLVSVNKGEMMLFNLDDDIGEQKDLARERPGLVEELLAFYKEWEKDVAGEN